MNDKKYYQNKNKIFIKEKDCRDMNQIILDVLVFTILLCIVIGCIFSFIAMKIGGN